MVSSPLEPEYTVELQAGVGHAPLPPPRIIRAGEQRTTPRRPAQPPQREPHRPPPAPTPELDNGVRLPERFASFVEVSLPDMTVSIDDMVMPLSRSLMAVFLALLRADGEPRTWRELAPAIYGLVVPPSARECARGFICELRRALQGTRLSIPVLPQGTGPLSRGGWWLEITP